MTKFQVTHVSCDRCGIEDDANGSELPGRWGQMRMPPHPDPDSTRGVGFVDLCPACVASVWQWLDRKAETEKKASLQEVRTP